MIKKLVVAFFQKVEEIEGIKSRNGKADFLVELILEKNRKEKKKKKENIYIPTTMSISTATRLQERYIDGKDGAELKKNFFKDIMAEYLGYIDYKNGYVKQQLPIIKPVKNNTNPSTFNLTYLENQKDKDLVVKNTNKFQNKTLSNTNETESESEKSYTKSTTKNWKIIIGFSSIPLIGSLLFAYPSLKTNNSNCIIWTGNQYEKTLCSTYNATNNNILHININFFKKIEVNQDSEFFINGTAVVWYGKNYNGVIEYFNSRGPHPETSKELKPITRNLLAKQGLLNE